MSAAALSGEKVRLVSREGHAFEVPREVAEVSMKIRDELAFHNSGSEGDDSGSEGDDQARVVHLYGTDAACLAKAIAFLTYHFTTPYYPADKPIRSNRFEDCVADCFDQEFVAKNVTAVPADREIDGSGKCDDGSWSKTVSLIDLARAAEYLEIDDMTDLVTVKIATLIKDRTPAEVDEVFDIQEVSEADMQHVYNEYPWLSAVAKAE